MARLLNCPNVEAISRLAAGELPDPESEALEHHVLTCSECAERLDALQTSDVFFRDVQAASRTSYVAGRAADELIDRLLRLPPDAPKASAEDDRAVARERIARNAEPARRAIVEKARGKQYSELQGAPMSAGTEQVDPSSTDAAGRILALDGALEKMKAVDEESAELVLLRCFAGLSLLEAAGVMGLSERAAERLWAFARAWLHREIQSVSAPSG